MKKVVFRVTFSLFISIFSLHSPNIGAFETPKASIEVSASSHSVKKIKKLKKKSKTKKKIKKVKKK